ncbi:MAG: glycoside hydrolase, partial [Chloroflexota bacterium]
MASIKLAYIGGGSTRAAGTMASLINQGASFAGSEVVLIDLNEDRLALVLKLAQKMAKCQDVDLRITATTDRRAGLRDCDAVLTSFRPGGFDARHLDESIPKKHGVIGQETQGAGGFFMALRSIAIMKGIVEDVSAVAPRARIFNYTNPVNLVAQAVTQFSNVPLVSLCEGPIYGPEELAEAAGLDPNLLDVASIGVNHCSWSVHATWDGKPFIPLLAEALPRVRDEASVKVTVRRMMELAVELGSIPSEYLMYYLMRRTVLEEQQAKATTRAQDIMAMVPDYWRHYEVQAEVE